MNCKIEVKFENAVWMHNFKSANHFCGVCNSILSQPLYRAELFAYIPLIIFTPCMYIPGLTAYQPQQAQYYIYAMPVAPACRYTGHMQSRDDIH